MGEVGALHRRVILPALLLCLREDGPCLLKVCLKINPWKNKVSLLCCATVLPPSHNCSACWAVFPPPLDAVVI